MCGNEGALATHITEKHLVTMNATSRVCFSKVMILDWAFWLAKMLSLEKINPMCTTIDLKRHVKAEEDIFYIASMTLPANYLLGHVKLSLWMQS